MQWHRDGVHLLTGDDDGFVSLWRFVAPSERAEGSLLDGSFSKLPDSPVWDVNDGAAQPTAVNTWRAHNFPITKLLFLSRVDAGRARCASLLLWVVVCLYRGLCMRQEPLWGLAFLRKSSCFALVQQRRFLLSCVALVSAVFSSSGASEESVDEFSQSAWAAAEAEREVATPVTDGEIGLVISTAATRISVWDGPWEDKGTTASASGLAASVGSLSLSPSSTASAGSSSGDIVPMFGKSGAYRAGCILVPLQ